MFRRRARTEAPISRADLGIGGHGLEIGPNGLPDAGVICVAGNLGRGRLALPQRFLQTFEREIEARAFFVTLARTLAVAEHINHRLGRVVDADADALDGMFFDTGTQNPRAEAD